jgi:hypothetical protein
MLFLIYSCFPLSVSQKFYFHPLYVAFVSLQRYDM